MLNPGGPLGAEAMLSAAVVGEAGFAEAAAAGPAEAAGAIK